MARWIGRMYGYYPTDPKEALDCDVWTEDFNDNIVGQIG